MRKKKLTRAQKKAAGKKAPKISKYLAKKIEERKGEVEVE